MVRGKPSSEKKLKLSIVSTPDSKKSSSKKSSTAKKKSPVPDADVVENSSEKPGDYTTPDQNLIDMVYAQMDTGTRKVLEGMYLGGMSLKQACENAGVKYYTSKSTITRSELARAYIEHLLERADVIREFKVDDLALVELVKIRNAAHALGQEGAATRAHEICMKAVGRLSKEEKPPDPLKDVSEMSREEMLAELNQLKLKADGQPLVSTEASVASEKEELLARNRAPQAPPPPPNEMGAQINDS